MGPRNGRLVRTGGVVLFVVAGVLLLSMGGAIFAAPLTLPLLVLVVRHRPTRAFRVAGTVIGGLTAAEVAWAIVYLTVGEGTATIWLVPLGAGVATAALLSRPASARTTAPAA